MFPSVGLRSRFDTAEKEVKKGKLDAKGEYPDVLRKRTRKRTIEADV